MQNKEINKRKHFTTWHGKFGLATFVLLLGTVVGGVVNKYNQGKSDNVGLLTFSALTFVLVPTLSNLQGD